ncbi:MAG: sensor histidine kinase, partial [Acidobacteriota bacterium]|nr:sensor histidine kinase [Acidobacteriota bacterium]
LGLGLSIARKAVRAQKGDVTVRNIPGKGCVFTIEVPLMIAAPVPPSAVIS